MFRARKLRSELACSSSTTRSSSISSYSNAMAIPSNNGKTSLTCRNSRLATSNVILLDIHGVGTAISKDAGLGVLRHLKKVAPAQVIVAYSNADWPLKYKEFFDLADATLDKRADYVEFKRTIDDLLQRRFSLAFYLDRIGSLSHSADIEPRQLQEVAKRAILLRDTDSLASYLRDAREERQTVGLILQVAQAGIAVLQLLVH